MIQTSLEKKIPKVIHYCWFGHSSLPPLAIKCIKSWKKYLPDYEIKEWNETNFNVNIIQYTKEAYEAKKYAFVSDYARFWILYNFGGLYFDTDVEIIKPLDDIIAKGPFMGCETEIKEENDVLNVAPGLGLGVNPGLGLYKELLNLYAQLSFKTKEGENNIKTVVEYTTDFLYKKGLKSINEIQFVDGIFIYPKEYFCPKKLNVLKLTPNSRTIHHYSGSWLPFKIRIKKKVSRIIGPSLTRFIIFLKQNLNKK